MRLRRGAAAVGVAALLGLVDVTSTRVSAVVSAGAPPSEIAATLAPALAAVARPAPKPDGQRMVGQRSDGQRLEAVPIGPELRAKGFHACNPPDPIGLGPYSKLRNLSMGRIAIPQRGGHTSDMGYDVLIHFHGGSPMRKTLVQVARGVAFVIIDKGMGSGPYAEAFASPDTFRELKRSIERALVEHSGDARAHIRHLGLTSWSAGYGAINEILKYGDAGIDAVVLLDSLHGSWVPGITGRPPAWRGEELKYVSGDHIVPLLKYAARAARGEKLFVLTHSDIEPPTYPSVKLTADLLLSRLGVRRTPLTRDAGLLEQVAAVDVQGLHVWGYRGKDELAHCGHLSLIANAVRDIVEPAWDTPAMDRSVPFTPAPILGGGTARAVPGESAAGEPAEMSPALPVRDAVPPTAGELTSIDEVQPGDRVERDAASG
jgi:hypothetical protein